MPSLSTFIKITVPAIRLSVPLTISLCPGKTLCQVAAQSETQMSPFSDKGIQSAYSVIPLLRTKQG